VAKARSRLGVALAIGVVAAGIALAAGGKELSPMLGWDATVLTYVSWMWLTLWRMDPAQTKALAAREDPTQASTDGLLLFAALASLAAVAVVLVVANSAHGLAKAALAGLAILSVSLSWLLVHTLFTLRYTLLYYRGKPEGGIDFNQHGPPQYSDFAYLAFTIGMTFQVSDTDLQTSAIRSTALRQAMLSYLFGAVILATTINLIAGLSGSGG
jgi:uncharacterized membrane protein